MASADVATNVIRMIMDSRHVDFIDTYYHWNLITADPDDNKFVDCAFAAGATYIVSDDSHFNVLRDITFPQLLVLRLMCEDTVDLDKDEKDICAARLKDVATQLQSRSQYIHDLLMLAAKRLQKK